MIGSFVTSSIWFFKGMLEYTKRGYEKAAASAPSFKNQSLPELVQSVQERLQKRQKPLVAIVTGANSGLGFETTYWLARSGVSTYMVCRNGKKAAEARDSILKRIQQESTASLSVSIDIRIVDVSKPQQLKSLVQEWKDAQRPLHILVNNAGALSTSPKALVTEDGLDESFATNSLSTYLLTEWFWPVLEATAKQESDLQDSFIPRVVAVSSGGMLTEKLDPSIKTVEPFDGTKAYAQTKRQQVEMTRSWVQKRNPSFFLFAMHPGWCDTPGVETSLPSFYANMKGRLRSLEQGADTIVWASLADQTELQSAQGFFLQDRVPISINLPLSKWTVSTDDEVAQFMSKMAEIKKRFDN